MDQPISNEIVYIFFSNFANSFFIIFRRMHFFCCSIRTICVVFSYAETSYHNKDEGTQFRKKERRLYSNTQKDCLCYIYHHPSYFFHIINRITLLPLEYQKKLHRILLQYHPLRHDYCHPIV